MVRQPWHPPYYQRLCEEAGLEKAVDLLMWELHIVGQRDKVLPVILEMAEKLEPEHGITHPQDEPAAAAAGPRRVRRDLQRRLGATTGASCPTPRRTSTPTRQELQLVFDRNWFMVAENATARPWAWRSRCPTSTRCCEAMNGRLLPLGWWHFLRRRRTIDRVRVGFLGVKPEYQHTGVAAGAVRRALRHGRGDAPEGRRDGLDPRDQRGHEPGDGGHGRAQIVKRYRVYEQGSLSSRRARQYDCVPTLRRDPASEPPAPSSSPVQRPVRAGRGRRPSAELQRRRQTVSLLAGAWRPPPAASCSAWPPSCWCKVLRRPKSQPARAAGAAGAAAATSWTIAASRSFLVDVHLLERTDSRRSPLEQDVVPGGP